MKPLSVSSLLVSFLTLAACETFSHASWPVFSETFAIKLYPIENECEYRYPDGEYGHAAMWFQETIEVHVSDTKPIDKDLETELNRCISPRLDVFLAEDVVSLANSCTPSLGIKITPKDVSLLSRTIVRKCGK